MKHKKKTKTIVLVGSLVTVLSVTALPGSANFLAGSIPLLTTFLPTSFLPTSFSFLPNSFLPTHSGSSPISGLQSQLMSFFNDFQTSLGSWGSQLQGQAISVTLGPLGLPDLTNFELDLDTLFSNKGEYLTLDEAQHSGVRQVTRAQAGQTFSAAGQQGVIERHTQISDGVNAIDAQAIAAQGDFVTQTLLKRLAIQNVQQGMLLGTVGSELTNLSVKQDLANYNLANISEGIDSQNLARQSELEGASLRVLQTSSLLRMD